MDYTPTIADLAKYDVNRPDAQEVIYQPLYDFQIYPTAGQQQFQFFQQAIGAGVTSAAGATAGSPKTKLDTNMTLNGQVPAPQAFLIEAVEVFFIPGNVSTASTFVDALPSKFATVAAETVAGAINDVSRILQNGGLRLFIGAKEYLFDTPLMKFVPGCFIGIDGALASNSATLGEASAVGARAMGRSYTLPTPVSLRANQNFNVSVDFGGAVATPSGFNGRIGVVLNGHLFRSAQ